MKKVGFFACVFWGITSSHSLSFAAAVQILNDINFPNPANISHVQQTEVFVGGTVINPVFQFTGSNNLTHLSGMVRSNETDFLPYGWAIQRLSEQTVISFAVTSPVYADIQWPEYSFTSNTSTQTIVRAYEFSPRISYSPKPWLTVGAGVHIDNEYNNQLNFFLLSANSNLVNKSSAWSTAYSAGLLLAFSKKTIAGLTYYSPRSIHGTGTSTLGAFVTTDYVRNGNSPQIIFVDLMHFINERWFVNGKVYWTNFRDAQQQIILQNTVIGTLVLPTPWRNTWSFAASTRYAFNPRMAMLLNGIYETNPSPANTNAVAYPLSPLLVGTAGIELGIDKNFSALLLYTYGGFVPAANIDSIFNTGRAPVYANACTLQLVWKA